MSGFVDEVEQGLLNHFFAKSTYTAPAGWFVGASTTMPADDGSNFTQPADGHARVATAPADWNTAAGAAPAQVVNAVQISFPTASGSWGTVVALGLFEASTGGTAKFLFELTTGQSVSNGQTLEFAAGTIKAQLGDTTDTFG